MAGIPTYEELMGPLLKGLKARGKAGIKDLAPEFAEKFRLSDEQKAETTPNTNVPVLNSRMHFAKWYLLKAGLIVRVKHGIYKITETGLSVLTSGDKVDSKYLEENCEEFRNWKNIATDDINKLNKRSKKALKDKTKKVGGDDGEDRVNSEGPILDFIKRLDSTVVEYIVVELLKVEANSMLVEHTGNGPNDKGIDAVVYSGPLGIHQTGVQVKRLDNMEVKYMEMQKFVGAIVSRKMINGIFVTTSKFSEGAKEVALQSNKYIRLVEGEELAKLIVEHKIIKFQGGKFHIKDIMRITENSRRKK